MQFNSLGDFLAMGGYAFYVWASYAVAVIVLATNIVVPWLRLRSARDRLARDRRLAKATDTWCPNTLSSKRSGTGESNEISVEGAMKARHARLLLVSVLVAGVGGAATLATMAMGENMLYFYSPTQLSQGAAQPGQAVRVGGLVVSGSVQRGDGLEVSFDLTDNAQSVTVRYTGILPDLFREGQGIVARGSMAGTVDSRRSKYLRSTMRNTCRRRWRTHCRRRAHRNNNSCWIRLPGVCARVRNGWRNISQHTDLPLG